MKKIKIYIKVLLLTLLMIFYTGIANAVQFNVVVLPSDIFNVCDNYFCYPEASEIAAEEIIYNLNSFKNISALQLSQVRSQLNSNQELKNETELMLDKFSKIERIDFNTLKKLSQEFNVKSIILVSAYITNEETLTKRNLWEILEISSAFKIAHPFYLNTNAILTDLVNDTVMWSGRYSKPITNSQGYFMAANQTQAASQLEKIKLYYKNNAALNISQNIKLRFFPKDVRTFTVTKSDENDKQFVPNALEHLSKPKLQTEIDELNKNYTTDDFIFEF